MDRRTFIGALAAGALAALPIIAKAQTSTRLRKIGSLSVGWAYAPSGALYRDRLRQLGWTEGQNCILVNKLAEGDVARLDRLAAELVTEGFDVIVAVDNSAIRAVQRATSKIPIVMVSASDPVGNGFVQSLRQPGGNITGVAWDQAAEIMGRYPQLLKELVPGLTRMGVIVDPGLTGVNAYVEAAGDASRKLGMTQRVFEVRKPDDLEPAFAQLASWGAQAVFVFGSPMILGKREHIVALARQRRLPAIYVFRAAVESGGLISYGVSSADLWVMAAGFVDKILRGANPADMPVELPTRYELVINLKTAKALGLTIPQTLLLRADEVIQ